MHGSIALHSVTAAEKVQVWELLRIEQIFNDFLLILLDSCEEARLSFSVPQLKQVHYFLRSLAILRHILNAGLECCKVPSFDCSVLDRLLKAVLKQRVLLKTFLEELPDFSLEVGLAS